jgi:hypothetical protein
VRGICASRVFPVDVVALAIVIQRWPVAARSAVFGRLGLNLIVQGALIRSHEYGFWPNTLPVTAVSADATVIDTRFGTDGHIALLAYRQELQAPGRQRAPVFASPPSRQQHGAILLPKPGRVC